MARGNSRASSERVNSVSAAMDRLSRAIYKDTGFQLDSYSDMLSQRQGVSLERIEQKIKTGWPTEFAALEKARGLEKALDFGSATAPRLSDKTKAARDNRDMTSTAVLAKGVAASVAEVVTGIRGRLYPDERLGESYRVVDQQIAEVAKHIITETANGKKDFDDYIEKKKYDFSYGMGTLNIGEKIVELGILEAKERLKSIK